MPQGILRLVVVTLVSILVSSVFMYMIGLTGGERQFVFGRIEMFVNKIFKTR